MRKFLIRSLAFTCFFLAVLSIVMAGLVRYNKSRNIYLDAYGKKLEMLKTSLSPRIILLGGSNVAFGFDSKSIADSLDVCVVNYGLQAGVGLSLMMRDVSTFCRKGDILVIAPEYEHFFGNAHGERTTLSVLSLLYPQVITRFDMDNFFVAAGGMTDAIAILMNPIFGKKEGENNSDYKYLSSSFNEFGDETEHWLHSHDDFTFKQNSISGNFDFEFFDDFTHLINDLKKDGIMIVIVPPSICEDFYTNNKSEINLLTEKLSEADMAFAISPESMVFPDDKMFDSSYHLSKVGIDIRMEMLIEIIKLNCGM